MNGARLGCLVATACLACGARTPLSAEAFADSGAGARSDAAPPAVTLSIPIGVYTGCASSTVTTRPDYVGSTGRDGAITLTREGDLVVAALAFPLYASGRVAFAPTARGAAALRASQTFAVQTANTANAVVPVTASAGSLAIVGTTLFISTHGSAGDDDVSAFFHCPIPAGLAPTDIATTAPPPGRPAPGVYGSCTATASTDGPVRAGLSGGSGAVTVTVGAESLRLAWPDSLLPELACSALDLDADPVAPALAAGQSCEMRQPCGPPPTLGPSPFPGTATLTNLQGSMRVNGGALFIDVRGDAPAMACGAHNLSITCANPSMR
jgi:hypothetical protein